MNSTTKLDERLNRLEKKAGVKNLTPAPVVVRNPFLTLVTVAWTLLALLVVMLRFNWASLAVLGYASFHPCWLAYSKFRSPEQSAELELRSSLAVSGLLQYEQSKFPVLSPTGQSNFTASLQLTLYPNWRLEK